MNIQRLLAVAVAFVAVPSATGFFVRSTHGHFRGKSLSAHSLPTTTTTTTNPDSKTAFVGGPPPDTKPDYDSIVGPLGKAVDYLFLHVFKKQLAKHAEIDSTKPGYEGIVEIAGALHQKYADRREIQQRAQETLRSLFPSWLPGQYAILFSKPFPEVCLKRYIFME